jgi:UDP-glucose 4-epimerase
MRKNVLILGGSGFIGRAVALLLAKNNYHVRVLSPSASRYVWENNIEAISGHIEDKGLMQQQTEWADLIVHAISTTNPKTSESDPLYDLNSNLTPLVQILEMIKNKPSKKIVFFSSGGGVYGKPLQQPIQETHPKNPSTSYGLVKSLMEEYIIHYHRNFGLPYLILRPSNPYGPKTRSIGEQGIISTLIYKSLHGQETQIWANPNNVRDYIFIDDCASASHQLIESNAEGIFNISSGMGFSLNDIISIVQSLFEEKLPLTFSANSVKDEPINILDNSKIMEATGWKPQTDMKEGVLMTYQFLKNHIKSHG